MGANQSGGQRQATDQVISSDGSRSGGILTVNPTPSTQTDLQQQIVLPKRVLPILTIEGNQIDPQRHKPDRDQLRPQLWSDFKAILSEFASSRSELVAERQAKLQEKVVQIDNHVQAFTDSYVNDKHKALARLNDSCRKLEEIDKQLQKCTLQGELCVSMLNKLNFLLPDAEKLEILEP